MNSDENTDFGNEHIDELYEYFKSMNAANDNPDDFELPADVHNDEINRLNTAVN